MDRKMMEKRKEKDGFDELFSNDYEHIGSSIGNAFFSGLTMEELWDCVLESKTKEELDFAVSATIWLKNICNSRKHDV